MMASASLGSLARPKWMKLAHMTSVLHATSKGHHSLLDSPGVPEGTTAMHMSMLIAAQMLPQQRLHDVHEHDACAAEHRVIASYVWQLCLSPAKI